MRKIRRAVALNYDRKIHTAPLIVAAGEGLVGERIEKIAREHQVPVVKDENLAKALTHLEIGTEIPSHLYQLVAEVLVYVMQVDERYASKVRKGS